ncbi:creatininase family protein [Gryllotalpicola reticulitermitis]|uniref:Creatininase family protein n=1 Tax=Gryllotalpicola reticulitermitis TaxID=1184153 RepID=A0ABV8Q181_9MICO
MRIQDRNWMQIEEYLTHDDRIVLPVGSTEQHGHLSLATDALLAGKVAVEAAEPLGIPVLPTLPFGMAPYFTEYPGSMSLRITTYIEVIRDLLDVMVGQGFRRIALINGHGGNAPVTGLIREWLSTQRTPGVEVLFHSWYNAPRTAAAAGVFSDVQLHGAWVENFPWTRVEGAEIPGGSIPPLPRTLTAVLSSSEMRKASPDGSHGGDYGRSDEDMQTVWDAGVLEVRELLENGWSKR